MIKTVGSICSGIEAASAAWQHLGFEFKWFSEIAEFPSKILAEKFPTVPNLGDMNSIASSLINEEIVAPDLICGGTPCQAFSLAGWKNGLNDERGNLTLKFIDIIEANDSVRKKQGLSPSVVFWENVEGVLTDKTNAFGCLVSSLAGFHSAVELKRWPNAGVLHGPKRNVAWRVLDAKFFGIPQQRRRLYVFAGGKDFRPEDILIEVKKNDFQEYPSSSLTFVKDGHKFEIFRAYTDCLYSAYGTKWNGNAAAYNGSLFVVQDQKLRRLSPLECERLMGFPDNYTNLVGAKKTNRYQAIGNSWAVPVIEWLGKRLIDKSLVNHHLNEHNTLPDNRVVKYSNEEMFYDLSGDMVLLNNGIVLNSSCQPEVCMFGSMKDIISPSVKESIYISPVGCHGIVRRKRERKLQINERLEKVLLRISGQMSPEEIEQRSLVQRRGKFSNMQQILRSNVEEVGA